MPTERRVLRLQQLILEVVAEALQRDVKDPRVGLVSVTRVKLSSDLSEATVGWSCLGTPAERALSEKGLEHALPFLQREVGKALAIRTTPHLRFRYDRSLERVQRLEDIFQRLEEERGPEAAAEGSPSGAAGEEGTEGDRAAQADAPPPARPEPPLPPPSPDL